MKPKRVSFVFTPGIWVCACLALAEGSLASCNYTIPVSDGTPIGGSGGGGGSTCGTALTNCDGTCVDTMSDLAHCGACSAACMMGLECINGQCKECKAGETIPCYDGPAATKNVGTCSEGLRTCMDNETGYGPCIGAQLPIKEICGNNLDDDCNGSPVEADACLTNDGLVVRYFLNEAANGQGPTTVMDSAQDPLHLNVDYGGSANMSFTATPMGRGLAWVAAGSPGTASASIEGTKVFTAFDKKTQGTMEVVAQFLAVTPSGSRIFSIGAGTEGGRFTLSSNTVDRVQFRWLNDNVIGDWPLSFGSSGRCVIHVVIDTTEVDAARRARLYVNGTAVQENTAMAPMQYATIDIGFDRHLYLGNRDGAIRSFGGSLYYAALYSRPLADNEIASHVSHLIIDDD